MLRIEGADGICGPKQHSGVVVVDRKTGDFHGSHNRGIRRDQLAFFVGDQHPKGHQCLQCSRCLGLGDARAQCLGNPGGTRLKAVACCELTDGWVVPVGEVAEALTFDLSGLTKTSACGDELPGLISVFIVLCLVEVDQQPEEVGLLCGQLHRLDEGLGRVGREVAPLSNHVGEQRRRGQPSLPGEEPVGVLGLARLLRIVQSRSLGYFREEHGDLIAFLRQRWAEQGGPELFGAMEGQEVESEVAWFDDSGRLVDGTTSRLDRILVLDEPNTWSLEGFKEPGPPTKLSGSSAQDIRTAQGGDWDIPVRMQISLHSDIWFPWVHGISHPLHTRGRKFDNRILAQRHTPRLNAFLEAVGAAAEAAGGTLSLDWDHCGVPREAVTDRGVVLDVPVPEDPMTHEEYSAPWPG